MEYAKITLLNYCNDLDTFIFVEFISLNFVQLITIVKY